MVYDTKEWRACTRKTINGKPYYYLREMARVDGRPKMVSERYLGAAEDVAAAMAGRDAASLPERTRHRGFGDVAAAPAWAPTWHWPH